MTVALLHLTSVMCVNQFRPRSMTVVEDITTQHVAEYKTKVVADALKKWGVNELDNALLITKVRPARPFSPLKTASVPQTPAHHRPPLCLSSAGGG